jgi:hypothetical protein
MIVLPSHRIIPRRLHAPEEDRTALIEPPPESVDRIVAANRRERAAARYDFQGCDLAELVRTAREELLAEARRWTSAYRDVPVPAADSAGPIFLAGHQPELFHPGVWFKNFVLDALARRHGATAINLVIDSDTMKTHTAPVPGGSLTRPEVARVPLDRPGAVVPFEERRIVDRSTFAEFGRAASRQIAPLVPNPLVDEYWPLAVERTAQTDNLGNCLAQARHQLEGRWGMGTLEVPQSRVCQLPAFGWYLAHVLAHLPRFAGVYNEAVQQYRAAHRIRSKAHPVPNLASDGPWLEAPFWIWTADNPRRRRLFAAQHGKELMLTDRQDLRIALPLGPDADARRAVEQLGALSRRGVKIRSRALLTTLWARLVLGDLFVHGIGGAKYDQVTDALLTRFFGLAPPGFLVVSATLLLPVPRPDVSRQDLASLGHRLRELAYHPERSLEVRTPPGDGTPPAGPDEAAALAEAKARWVQTPPAAETAWLRWREIRRINEALQPWVAGERRRLAAVQAQEAAMLAARSILASRQYAFCLFPEPTLREFLLGLLPKNAQTVLDKAR